MLRYHKCKVIANWQLKFLSLVKGTPDIRTIVTGSQTAWATVNGIEHDLSWGTPGFQHHSFTSPFLLWMTLKTQNWRAEVVVVTTQQVSLPISCARLGHPCKIAVDLIIRATIVWERFISRHALCKGLIDTLCRVIRKVHGYSLYHLQFHFDILTHKSFKSRIYWYT